MKRFVVTGGCGFIGSNFIRRLIRNPQATIINIDKLTYAGNLKNTLDFSDHPRYRFIKGDICDSKLIHRCIKPGDTVIHFAAETHVDRSIDKSDDFLQTNVIGTRVLLEACRNVRIRKFIHISTDEVYGSVLNGAAREDAPLRPNSPYAASKAASDLLVRAYFKTYKLPAVIVRSSNNYGPYQYPEKVIPLFVTNLIQNMRVPLYGTGLNRRQWIHVEDNCDAINLVVRHARDGEIYNIGAGNELANIDLSGMILKCMGKSDLMIQKVKDRAGHDFRYSINTQKIRQIGFKPKWKFASGLRQTIQWYQQHSDWWLPLKRNRYTVK